MMMMMMIVSIVIIIYSCTEVVVSTSSYSIHSRSHTSISSKSTNFSLKISSNINLDVWMSVMRVGTKDLRGVINETSSGYIRFQGWYEGYSAGIPVDDTRINTTKTTYGCWHRAFPSNIYVNIKRALFLPLKDHAKDYFSKHLNKSMVDLGLISRFDKYYCKAALELGYQTMIYNLPMKGKVMDNYEVAVCDGGCSTVTFNTTCAPIDYQHLNHDDNAFHACNCNDSYDSLNCNNDLYQHNYSPRHEKEKFNMQYQNSKIHPLQSIYNIHRCIMNFEYIRYKMNKMRLYHSENNKYHRDDLTIVVATNIVNYPSIEYHKKLSSYTKANNGNNNRTVLLLNFETDNYDYFGYNMKDLNHLHHTYKYHEMNYPLPFKQALNHSHCYHMIKDWISPWDELVRAKSNNSSARVLLYSNIGFIENAKIFQVNSVLVAVIMYDIRLTIPSRNIISTDHLLQWIHFKALCLRKLGTDVIVVMGNGDYIYSNKILAQNHNLITTVLGTDSSSSSSSSSNLYNDVTTRHYCRVFMLPTSMDLFSPYNHTSNLYVTKIQLHFNHRSSFSVVHSINEL